MARRLPYGARNEDRDPSAVLGECRLLVVISRADHSPIQQIGPLNFPSPSDSFPSARDLFIHLYAYAAQNGFAIYRYGGTTTAASATLLCDRAHDRYSQDGGGFVRVEG